MSFQIKRISSSKPDRSTKPQSSWKYTTKTHSSKKYQADLAAFYISEQSTMTWSSLQFKSAPKTLIIPNMPTNNNRGKTKNTLRSILTSGISYVEQLRISSTSWCLYDENKQKYIGFRQRHQRQIASLTKIMTTILSIQFAEKYELSPELFVKVTENASRMIGTTADLKQKTWIRFRDLLYGAMLPSGNDAAYLLSQVVGYIYKLEGNNKAQYLKNLKFLDISNQNTTFYTIQFVKLMNKKAEQIGLCLTKFSNPHGLQNALNVSSPRDMLSLSCYAAKNQQFRKIMNTQFHRYEYIEVINNQQQANKELQIKLSESKIQSRSHNQNIKLHRRIWQNTNLLLKKGWEGVKTGQTGSAGSCLSSVKNGIFIVILNCKDNDARFTETEKIYNWYTNKKNNQSTDDEDNLLNKV